jgi:hypothetical protein
MHQQVQEIFNFSIGIREVIGNTLWASFCGIIVSVFYVIAFRGIGYSVNLIKAIVMLTMITAFVMMVVGDNLAQAFIMVGILSLIRFRTAIKDAQDFMFLFFALAIGLACGEGLYLVALVGCLLIGIATTGMTLILADSQQNFILTLAMTDLAEHKGEYKIILHSFCARYKLVGTKALTKDSDLPMQFRYLIGVKKAADNEAFVEALRGTEGIRQVNLEVETE